MKRLSFGRTMPALVSALALGAGVVAMNDDIRRYAAGMFGRRGPAGLGEAGWQVQEVARLMFQAVKDQTIEHAPLTIFAVAAGVLLLFMLRV